MNHLQLDELLRSYDPIEQIQVKTRTNVNDFGGAELEVEPDGIPRMRETYFFDDNSVFINKHHRFADMRLHTHEFIELNYMYAGSCLQLVNGSPLTLREGEICLLDRDVPHSIAELGTGDILVNILLRKEVLSALVLRPLADGGPVGKFLVRALSEHRKHDRYIVFHSGEQHNLHVLLHNMMCEFFDGDDCSSEMLKQYIPLVFTELMRVYRMDSYDDSESQLVRADIQDVIAYISDHYRGCTLKELAARFNFHPNYLGSLLKATTGNTFSRLVQLERLKQAALQLIQTETRIADIALDCGYESHGFFYQKFKSHYGMTPSRYRLLHR